MKPVSFKPSTNEFSAGDEELPSTPTTGIAGCCARAASGQAAAEPTILMKSRRRIPFLKA